MLLLRIWNFFRGYVIIRVKGYFIEKFINLCANKGIYLWDIKRELHNCMTLKISIRGFKALKGIAGKTKCKIKILKKIGLPFIKFRYRKRKSFIAGFIIFLVLIYILSSFIWVIEINGVKRVNPQQIVDFLGKFGIKPGVVKFRIDKDVIVPQMIIAINDISWADINLKGTKVIVNIVERIPEPKKIDRKTPCNILAKNSGVIKSIITKNGTALVKEGDVVRKGQLLITGIIENKLNPQEVRYVHSEGNVYATTWHQETVDIRLTQVKRERTGEFRNGYGFRIFSNYYNILMPKNPYKIFDVEEKNIRISLWKNFELPIEFVVKKYYKVQYNKYVLSEETAKENARIELFKKLDKKISKDVKIVDKKIEYQLLNDIIRVTAIYECVEDIGYKEKITKD